MERVNYLDVLCTLANDMRKHEKRIARRKREKERARKAKERKEREKERESAYFARTTFEECKGVRNARKYKNTLSKEKSGTSGGARITTRRFAHSYITSVCKTKIY